MYSTNYPTNEKSEEFITYNKVKLDEKEIELLKKVLKDMKEFHEIFMRLESPMEYYNEREWKDSDKHYSIIIDEITPLHHKIMNHFSSFERKITNRGILATKMFIHSIYASVCSGSFINESLPEYLRYICCIIQKCEEAIKIGYM